jgi:SHAQKYF class myb-like DNA-binding protein
MSISSTNNIGEQSVSLSNNRNDADGNESATSNKPKRKRSSSGSSHKGGQTCGRWTQEEHQAFLEGLKDCGREWKKVAMRIPTRTSAQIRSHAQKYFAKLQRDQENNSHYLLSQSSLLIGERGAIGSSSSAHGDLPHFSPAAATAAVVAREGGLLSGSTIATHPPSSLAPSVQRNVERIIADPVAAQQEVENTLQALRERYRQLQLRLDARRQQRQLDRRDEGNSINYQNNELPRKRPLRENPMLIHRHAAADENSSVSSNMSSVAASRDLDNEEIIALQVLGGSLPRGDSSVEDNASSAAADHTSSNVIDTMMMGLDDQSHHTDVDISGVVASPVRSVRPQNRHQESKSPDVSLEHAEETATAVPSNHEEQSSAHNKRQRHEY